MSAFTAPIELVHATDVTDQFLAGYSQEKDAAVKIVRDAVSNGQVAFVLCFGMPGCGKSIFAKKVAYEANSLYKAGCSVLIFRCNECAQSPGTDEIDNNLYKVRAYLERWCPMIVCLDELDYIAPDRLRQYQDPRYGRLATKMMGLIGSRFAGAIPAKMGVVVFLITNTPRQLEIALVDRVNGGSLYFPLPTESVAVELLVHFGVFDAQNVYRELNKLMKTGFFTGRGLFEACSNVITDMDSRGKKLEDLSPQAAALAIYRRLPPLVITHERVEQYLSEHEGLIGQAEAFLNGI